MKYLIIFTMMAVQILLAVGCGVNNNVPTGPKPVPTRMCECGTQQQPGNQP